MTTQNSNHPMFYRNPVPLSRERHKGWHVDMSQGYHFTRETNSIFIAGTEFPFAARDYPIVFAQDPSERLVPVVMLGLRQNQNLMVDDAGVWQGGYVPAYIRRYPFILANSDEQPNAFAVCIDEAYSGFNTAGEGERLLTEAGEHSELMTNTVKFLEEFHKHSMITEEFSKTVRELDLVEAMQANFKLKIGGNFSLSGLYCVPRNKIKGLSPDQLKALVDRDYLDLIYLHMYSLRNLDKLIERYDGSSDEGAPTPQ